jgi:hypothetical protein
MKRDFSEVTFREIMQQLGQENLLCWQMDAPPRPPSARLRERWQSLQVFGRGSAEQAESWYIDALLMEVVPDHPKLKVWKGMPLETDTLMGIADYLIAPKYAYLETPVLCGVEARRDDFERARTLCIVQMDACRRENAQAGRTVDIHGFVSNGAMWHFYRLARDGAIYETEMCVISQMPELLGALDTVCAECAKNIL